MSDPIGREEMVKAAADALYWAGVDGDRTHDLATAVLDAVEPLIREQIAREIAAERHYVSTERGVMWIRLAHAAAIARGAVR